MPSTDAVSRFARWATASDTTNSVPGAHVLRRAWATMPVEASTPVTASRAGSPPAAVHDWSTAEVEAPEPHPRSRRVVVSSGSRCGAGSDSTSAPAAPISWAW